MTAVCAGGGHALTGREAVYHFGAEHVHRDHACIERYVMRTYGPQVDLDEADLLMMDEYEQDEHARELGRGGDWRRG